MDLAFTREIRITGTQLYDEFDVAARSMASRNARLLITNQPVSRWVLGCDGDASYSSHVLQSATPASSDPPFIPRFWVRRLPVRVDRGVRIGGMEVTSLAALPLEQLLHHQDPFALLLQTHSGSPLPISDHGALVEIEIAASDRQTAELVSAWLGGLISETRVTSYAYVHELVYFFRPPVQSTAYFPDGVLAKSPDLLEVVASDPLRLTRHLLICGQAGSGKTNTAKLLLLRLLQAKRPEGLLVLDPRGEYGDLAAFDRRWSIQCIGAGSAPEQLGLLNINPFLPAPEQRLDAHLDMISMIFSVSAFRGAGVNLTTYMRQVLRMFVCSRWARGNGWSDPWQVNREKQRAILAKTGQEVCAEGFLAAPRGQQSTLFELCDYWSAQQQKILGELTGGHVGAHLADLGGVLTARVNELEMSLLGHFDYSPQGRPLAALLRTPAIISLQGASEADTQLLVSLLVLGSVEAALLQPASDRLRTLIVIEEAHRVMLRDEARSAEYEGARERLASTLGRAFRELRSRGVGLVAIDQSPHTLIDEAFANTGSKVAHRLQLPEDQERMKEVFQTEMVDLGSLQTGECLVKIEDFPAYRTRLPRWDGA
jgi:hypothetical protein